MGKCAGRNCHAEYLFDLVESTDDSERTLQMQS